MNSIIYMIVFAISYNVDFNNIAWDNFNIYLENNRTAFIRPF